MRYKKTNRTRRNDIVKISHAKNRFNKQAMTWHEQLDRQMMARITREEDKYFGRAY